MRIAEQFARFALTGAGATAIHYAMLVVLVQFGATAPVVATSIGFAVSAVFNYLMNARYTFGSDGSHRRTLPRFGVVAASGLVLNGALMWMIEERFGLPYLIAQVAATLVVLGWNFALNRAWTFSRPAPTRGA